MQIQNSNNNTLITNLTDLLNGGKAHVTLDDALKNIPFDLLDKKPGGLPYSIWQISEHIRIAQWDILSSHTMKSINHPNGLMNIGLPKISPGQKANGKNASTK